MVETLCQSVGSLPLTVLARTEALKDAETMLAADALCMRSEQQLHLVSLPLFLSIYISFYVGWGRLGGFTHSAASAAVLTRVNPPPRNVCNLKMD